MSDGDKEVDYLDEDNQENDNDNEIDNKSDNNNDNKEEINDDWDPDGSLEEIKDDWDPDGPIEEIKDDWDPDGPIEEIKEDWDPDGPIEEIKEDWDPDGPIEEIKEDWDPDGDYEDKDRDSDLEVEFPNQESQIISTEAVENKGKGQSSLVFQVKESKKEPEESQEEQSQEEQSQEYSGENGQEIEGELKTVSKTEQMANLELNYQVNKMHERQELTKHLEREEKEQEEPPSKEEIEELYNGREGEYEIELEFEFEIVAKESSQELGQDSKKKGHQKYNVKDLETEGRGPSQEEIKEVEENALQEDVDEIFRESEEREEISKLDQEIMSDSQNKTHEGEFQDISQLQEEMESLYNQEKVQQEIREKNQEIKQDLIEKTQNNSKKKERLKGKRFELIYNNKVLSNYNPNQTFQVPKGGLSLQTKVKTKTKTKEKKKETPKQKSFKTTAKKMEFARDYGTREEIKENVESQSTQTEDEKYREETRELIQKAQQEVSRRAEKKKEIENRENQEQSEVSKENLKEINQKDSKEIKKEKDDSKKELYELYKKEMGRRAIYGRYETKGYREWEQILGEQQEEDLNKRQEIPNKNKEMAEYHQNREISEKNQEQQKEQRETIRRFHEEWAKYLTKTIRDSKDKEIFEENKEELIEILSKYNELHNLVDKLKKREISKQEAEKELEKLEETFSENGNIEIELFKNFRWFQGFYQKNRSESLLKQEEKKYLRYISKRLNELKNAEETKKSVELVEEPKEENWAIALKYYITQANEEEIPEEIKEEITLINWVNQANKISKEEKEELIKLIEKYKKLRVAYKKKQELELKIKNKTITEEEHQKYLELKKNFENISPFDEEIFRDFKKFLDFYKQGNLWGNNVTNWERGQFVNTLIQKFRKLKEIERDFLTEIIKKNSDKLEMQSKNKNMLQNHPSNKSLAEQLREFLDSKKDEIVEGKFIPSKDNIIAEREEFENYKGLNTEIYRWFQNNTRYNNLTQLKNRFLGKTLTAKLYKFLDSKEEEILKGIFIPSKENIVAENREFEEFKEINNRIAKWLKKNTPFSGVKDLKKHFKGIPLVEKLKNFLNLKKNEILNGEFVPDKKNIISVMPELENYYDLHVIVYKWIKKNTPFDSLTLLKRHFFGKPLAKKLRAFLNSKKEDILKGTFIPDTKNIISERPEFDGYSTLSLIVGQWLKKNTEYKNITDLKTKTKILIPDRIRKFLDSIKKDILKGRFFPTKNNLGAINEAFKNYNHTNDVVNKWLKKNSKFKNLTELIRQFNPSDYELHPESIIDRLRKLLDSKENEILNGVFFPTVKNLRKIDEELANYSYTSRIVSIWIRKKSKSKFKNLTELISHFEPTSSDIGNTGSHGYTATFESESYKVKNFWLQIVKILDKEKLIQIDLKKFPKKMKNLIRFLEQNPQWNVVDILTGEIIDIDDIQSGNYALHHIDRNKQNDDLYNVVVIFGRNHGVITQSQQHFEKLSKFFEDLLKKNIKLIKYNKIPESWKVSWRILASKEGIKLPVNKYKNKENLDKKIINSKNRIKDMGKWLK